MIASLSGTVRHTTATFLVLDVGGVGYKVHCTSATLTSITEGDTLFLHIHMVVREDAMELFGFATYPELALFELLIGISGVGPRSALGILALDSVSALAGAIASGNVGYLTTVSGVGKKSAEKIVLELREKVSHLTTEETTMHTSDEDVLEALVSLGYSTQQAREALKALPPEITDQAERIKAALRHVR
jgi:Holliday junction DNA helicase RuvA